MAPHKDFISTLMAAVSTSTLYSIDHPTAQALVEKSLSVLADILSVDARLEIMMVEEDLVVNRTPLRDGGNHEANLKKRLKRKGISRIDFVRGVTAGELAAFIGDLAGKNRTFAPYPHIKTGVIDVRVSELKADVPADTTSQEKLTEAQLGMARELFDSISPFKQLNVAGLEEIVVNFFITFKREAHFLRLISPVKSHSEYTYTHAANVAVLSMFQAESLGIKDAMLHEIGIAALLHDVGKLFLPVEILNKKGKLTQEEFQKVTQHTTTGAKYLAGIDGLTRLAPIVAFEHHMRYDGTGYPSRKREARRQHIVSQIVQISDFFDALRSKRPYKKDWEIDDIIALMMENSGSEFNGELAKNFAKMLHMAISK